MNIMSLKMLVSLRTDQRLAMNAQLRQAISLLQYNTLEITQYVKQALENNPLLEADEGDLSQVEERQQFEETRSYSADISKRSATHSVDASGDNIFENYTTPVSLRAHLLDQSYSSQFTDKQQQIAECVIDIIDDEGFLTMSFEDTLELLKHQFDVNEIELQAVINKIQGYDPCGVAAHDLRESFLLQLNDYDDNDKDSTWSIAYKIVDEHLNLYSFNHTKELVKQLNVSYEQFQSAVHLIRELNPKPGLLYADTSYLEAEPELYVENTKNGWQVFLRNSLLTNISINKEYQSLIKKNRKEVSFQSLKAELEEASFLLKGIEKRNQTLLMVASYIVEMQTEFLDHGPLLMKSMNNAEVADALGIHESTVSRITSGKYMSTPKGVFELKYFFPSYVNTLEGGQCSATAVKAMIKQCIDQESVDTVLSDADLALKLSQQGVTVSRRTVAKYREAMKCLPSYLRKKNLELA
jgi:RNA polymerase sigma-54 factor